MGSTEHPLLEEDTAFRSTNLRGVLHIKLVRKLTLLNLTICEISIERKIALPLNKDLLQAPQISTRALASSLETLL